MYVSRLNLQTRPGRTRDAEAQLKRLRDMVIAAGAGECRILHAHYASPGAPDLVFEQVGSNLAGLESNIRVVVERPDFQEWSAAMSALLTASPKREVYLIASDDAPPPAPPAAEREPAADTPPPAPQPPSPPQPLSF